MPLLVKNVRLIDPAQGMDTMGALLVEDGLVAAIGDTVAAEQLRPETEILDGRENILCPGFIDLHVHFREPGQTARETIETGCMAAVAGGFTSVCAMANTKPVNDSTAITQLMLNSAAKTGLCRYFPLGALTRGMAGEELADYGTLKNAGCIAFSDDGNPVMNAAVFRKAMEYTEWLGVTIAVHEEDKNLAGSGYMNEGATSAALGCPAIPASAEESMVSRDIVLARHTKSHIHFQHLSTKGSLETIRCAKKGGLSVTCEVTPHHFALTDSEIKRFDANFKMNPPLRTQADIDAILEALADGTVDAIATDHAPHTYDDKELELANAPFGIIGLETALPLTIELLVNRNVIGLSRAIELLTSGPAKIFHLDKKGLGSLAVGNPADFTLFDPSATIRVDRAFIKSKAFNTPFKDWELHGKILGTWVGGKRVFDGNSM
ncbi:MAG: dihydroorotase [Holophagales bacterium]|jgi:dihydroorotase|nr:dihydroorotase [Holophagales bacterium]